MNRNIIPVRRIYLAAMCNGSIGIGVARLDSERSLVTGEVPIGNRDGQLDYLQWQLAGLDPEEVVVSLPDAESEKVGLASVVVVSIANAFRCDVTRIVTSDEVQILEHLYGSHKGRKRAGAETYAIETVERLHLAYRTAQRCDIAFGRNWSFSSEAVFERMAIVSRLNSELRKARQADQLALAECEAASITVFQ